MSKRATIPLSYWAEVEKIYLTPAEAAAVLGCDPYKISVQAATEEGRVALGFPVIRLGHVTKIPRAPFLRYMGWEGEIKGGERVTKPIIEDAHGQRRCEDCTFFHPEREKKPCSAFGQLENKQGDCSLYIGTRKAVEE